MKFLTRTLLFGALSAALSPAVLAQEPPPPAPTEEEPAPEAKPFPLKAALATLKPGTVHFGVYMNTKNIGLAEISATASEPDGWDMANQMQVQMGPQTKTLGEKVRLRADGSLRSLEQTDASAKRTKKLIVKMAADGGATRQTIVTPGGEGEPTDETEAIELPNGIVPERLLYMLLGAMEWKPKTRYTIHSEDDTEPVVIDCACVKQEDIDWRGETVPAWRLEMNRSEGKRGSIVHVAKGRVLVWAMEGIPVKLVAGTKEQCGTDLTPAAAAGSDQAVVLELAKKFFLGFLAGDPKLVDEVTNYETLRSKWAEKNPDIGMLTVEAIQKIMGEKVAARAGSIPEEQAKAQADLVAAAMITQVKGELAEVEVPGNPHKLHFGKNLAGEWKFIWWEVFNQG